MGAQRTNGVFGALIIKEKPKENVTPPTDVIMQVGDWHHERSEEVNVCLQMSSLFVFFDRTKIRKYKFDFQVNSFAM